jgi:hexosaminidase
MKARTFTKTFTDHKAMGRKVTANTEAHHRYKVNYPDNLTDGIKGVDNYASGEWVGMNAQPFDVIVEMDGLTRYSSVTLGTFVVKGDWVFNPSSITVSVSKNDADYQTVAREEYEVFSQQTPDGRYDYKITFPETDSKYLRIVAKTVESMPAWHPGHGRGAFLFVDEVTVE